MNYIEKLWDEFTDKLTDKVTDRIAGEVPVIAKAVAEAVVHELGDFAGDVSKAAITEVSSSVQGITGKIVDAVSNALNPLKWGK